MTKHRPAGSIEAALLEALNDLTDRELGDALGKSRSHLYACADPAKREQLHFADAVKLDRALAGKGLAPRFLPILRLHLGGAAPAGVPDLLQGLARAMAELGDVSAVVSEATGDGVLDAAERRRIAKELQELIAVATQLLVRIEPSGQGPQAATFPPLDRREPPDGAP